MKKLIKIFQNVKKKLLYLFFLAKTFSISKKLLYIVKKKIKKES